MNVLLITVDDMNHDSMGCMGCKTPDITPNIDQLAREGMLCDNSYVGIALCQPSRSVLLTGRYPHKNGARGFEEIDFCVTTLTERLREYGYINGVIGKVEHAEPREKFAWDFIVKTLNEQEGWGRDPEKMYQHTCSFLKMAREENKPFFLMANSHDPHRPYAGSEFETPEYLAHSGKNVSYDPNIEQGEYYRGKYVKCNRYYSPEEVEIPGFLPDLPDIKREIADYYSSVHRADEAVGRILDALADEGFQNNTLVMFLSDNGAALPFAKTNCYLNSTRSPFIFRLPGVIPAGNRTQALISSIDYTPTVLDFLEINPIEGVDGKSLKGVLVNGEQHQYDTIYTLFFKTARNFVTGKERHYPMRCVQSTRHSYIYNSWFDSGIPFLNESTSGLTFKAMQNAAERDEEIRKRVDFFMYRAQEEFYDIEQDPDCLHNLIDNPEYRCLVDSYRKKMYQYMNDSQDALIGKYKETVMKKNYL